MRLRAVLLFMSLIAGCASRPPVAKRTPESAGPRTNYDREQLRLKLGIKREPEELGFSEQVFDGCSLGVKGEKGKCGIRYLAVVNFRLVCRDTDETAQQVVTQVRPLAAKHIHWQIDPHLEGSTSTDESGLGHLLIVSPESLLSHRLGLTIGIESVGREIEAATPLVLPNLWCQPH